MNVLKRIALLIDTIFERFALASLVAMVLIVIMQVFTRKLGNFVFFWSEEVTLLLLAWFTYMGIAIGFREKLHLEMDLLQSFLSDRANWALDKVIQLCTLAFGIYLIYSGWEFTVLMWDSTLPATKLPNSALYVVMPITGVMICAYTALQLLGVDTKRHTDLGGEAD